MNQKLSQRLKAEKNITDEQIRMALERQKTHGGRLGKNLAALGFITEEELDSFLLKVPPIPDTVEDTGLTLSYIADLVMKHALFLGEFSVMNMSDKVCLPVSIIDVAIDYLRRDHLLEVKGMGQFTKASYQYAITEQGKGYAEELMEVSRYVGPAPVTLDQYIEMVEEQSVKNILVGEHEIKKAFAHLVVSDRLLERLGPAVSSGKAMFLYGPAGNGKTSIAETIAGVLPDIVFVPHAVLVERDIIVVYDPVNHIAPKDEQREDNYDRRWKRIHRPIIMSGGELTLEMLDLQFNTISKFYEAPLQMKANTGLFIVDDFGRQQVDAMALLNRWIVPLERHTDFLSLTNGIKFEIPFDQLTIFSTNLEPRNLVDEAFLRRIRYKVKIDHPSPEAFERIFRRVCKANGIEFNQQMFYYLMEHYYQRLGVKLNACHPRDLIEQIVDIAHYRHTRAEITKESLAVAWENYFVDF